MINHQKLVRTLIFCTIISFVLFKIALTVPYNGPYNKIAAINALLAQMQQGAGGYCKNLISISLLTMMSCIIILLSILIFRI